MKIVDGFLYGNEGDRCPVCEHLFCYHCDNDPEDGTVGGCQVQVCNCKNIWKGPEETT